MPELSHLQAVVLGAARGRRRAVPDLLARTLHVATALALLVFYRRDWMAISGGFLRTLRSRRVTSPTERLAWLVLLAGERLRRRAEVREHVDPRGPLGDLPADVPAVLPGGATTTWLERRRASRAARRGVRRPVLLSRARGWSGQDRED